MVKYLWHRLKPRYWFFIIITTKLDKNITVTIQPLSSPTEV